jgi:ABC-2 type transport system permease protein
MRRRLVGLVGKEFAQIFRDPPLLFILVWAFTAAVYAAGTGRAMEITEVATAVYDLSRGPASREFLSRLQRPYFKPVGYLTSEAQVAACLDQGTAAMVVVIPPDFQRDVDGGGQAHIQVLTDGALAMSATLSIAYLAAISARYSIDVLERRAAAAGWQAVAIPSLDERVRARFNPNMSSAWFGALLEMLNMCTMVSLLLTAASLVREKERGTIEQLLVSPARPVEIFFAKIIPTVIVVVTLTAACMVTVLGPAFHMPMRGSVGLFFGVTALYAFAMTSMGIAIALVARNMSQGIMMMILILQPMIFLSGAWNPPEAMSPWLRWLSYASPLRYYIDFAFGVVLKGNTLPVVTGDVLGIAVLGGVLFAFSLMWFERSLSSARA